MQEDFIKETKVIEKSELEKERELIKSIIKTREELKMANKNFEFAECELIDYYTYQIKANQAKLDYLIKLAKARGIVLDIVNELKFRVTGESSEAV